MFTTNSPNMTLPIPSVGIEIGPDYAFDVNNCLSLVDSHDHTPGRGVQITPGGININTDLSFSSNSATNLLNAVFTAQSVATNTLQALSVAPGTEGTPLQDLWYTDSAGNKVQITDGGALAAVTTTVQGITYSIGTFSFRQTQDSLPTTPANIDAGSVTIRPNTAATSLGARLLPSGGISSQYDLTLPLPVAATNFVTLDSSGVISGSVPIAAGIQNSMLAPIPQSFITTSNVGKTTNYTAVNTDDQLIFDLTSAAATLTMYSPSGNTGRTLYVQKVDTTLNALTITGTGVSTTLNTYNESVSLMSDGVNWHVFSRTIPGNPTYYTPATQGFGSPAMSVYSYRDGRNLVMYGTFTVPSVQASLAQMTIGYLGVNTPSGLNKDTSAGNALIGTWGNPSNMGTMLIEGGAGVISFSQNQNANPALGSQIAAGGTFMRFNVTMPIVGWND